LKSSLRISFFFHHQRTLHSFQLALAFGRYINLLAPAEKLLVSVLPHNPGIFNIRSIDILDVIWQTNLLAQIPTQGKNQAAWENRPLPRRRPVAVTSDQGT